MNFGTSYTGAETKPCATCKGPVSFAERMVVERETIHKQCFKCAICVSELKHGSCAMYKSPGVKGLRWLCTGPGTKQCAMLSPGEKDAKIKSK